MRRQPRMRREPPSGSRAGGRTALWGGTVWQMGNADIHRGADTNALIAPRVITGAINGPAFDTCIETQLAPALDPGTVVILDNLSTHKSPPAARRPPQRP